MENLIFCAVFVISYPMSGKRSIEYFEKLLRVKLYNKKL